MILSRGMNEQAQLDKLADRIREAFADPVTIADTSLQVRLSVDGSLYAAGERSEDVLNRADSAMYRVKRGRRLVTSEVYRTAG